MELYILNIFIFAV